jgi:hypothetical protein
MSKIWTYKESESAETDNIDIKTFKPTGKFYDDIETLTRTFGVRVHPALKPKPPAHQEGE